MRVDSPPRSFSISPALAAVAAVAALGTGLAAFVFLASAAPRPAIASETPPRCEAVPMEGDRVSLQIDGIEKLGWQPDPLSPRPYFFPLRSPSGASLTRMGHPGAPNHDHHRSVWFAHQDVEGHDFWSESGEGRIRQRRWLAMEDGDEAVLLAVELEWTGPDGVALLEQTLVVALRPLPDGSHEMEFQSDLRAAGGRRSVRLGKTNFGLFAVRVAKSISSHFGGGMLVDAEGREGEKEIFGQRARWVDYSGRVAVGEGPDRRWELGGLTYCDHPGNPRHPSRWHVREDGWMGASLCFDEALEINSDEGLRLRYLLHAHDGFDRAVAEARWKAFAARRGWRVERSERPHRHYEIVEED